MLAFIRLFVLLAAVTAIGVDTLQADLVCPPIGDCWWEGDPQ